MVPLLFVIFATRLGARATAGEEQADHGLLLSTPVPRMRVVGQKFAAMVVAAALGLVLWGAFAVGATAMDMGVSMANLAGIVAGAALLGLAFGSLALLVGALRGSRGAAVAVTSIVAVATYLLNAIAAIAPGHLILLNGLASIAFIVSLAAFDRRDIAT
jgi:ABC-2 type transport system permease protein